LDDGDELGMQRQVESGETEKVQDEIQRGDDRVPMGNDHQRGTDGNNCKAIEKDLFEHHGAIQ
jgi:hypothetical protein